MKLCRGCQTEKPLEDFSLAKRGKFGRAFYCRPCAAAKRREHYAANPDQRPAHAERMREYLRDNPEQREKDIARSKAWAKANAEAVNRRNREWREANPEAAASWSANWRRANPDRAREHVERRRARKVNAEVNDFTASDWRDVLREFNHSCAYCLCTGIPLQQEHLTPLSRGGDHTRSNIVPACGPCNNSKGVRDLLGSLSIRRAA